MVYLKCNNGTSKGRRPEKILRQSNTAKAGQFTCPALRIFGDIALLTATAFPIPSKTKDNYKLLIEAGITQKNQRVRFSGDSEKYRLNGSRIFCFMRVRRLSATCIRRASCSACRPRGVACIPQTRHARQARPGGFFSRIWGSKTRLCR